MSATIELYESFWNDLSWEVASAKDAWVAVLAGGDWLNVQMPQILKGERKTYPLMGVVFLFSNALTTHFFIAACKIRETTNSQTNLVNLLKIAEQLLLLSEADRVRANELIASTDTTFKLLKHARGTAVAHLHNASNPHMILSNAGVSRLQMFNYFADLDELFWLLGKQIGKSRPGTPPDSDLPNQIQQAFELLWPN